MSIASKLGNIAVPLSNSSYMTNLLTATRQSSVVLIGDGSHGTEEFYKARIDITKKLIEESNFTFVAIEASFNDTYKINKFVHGELDQSIETLLNEFDVFPTWVWNNYQFLEFVKWLRLWNSSKSKERMVGIYGMDLYSMYKAMKAVVEYLEVVDEVEAEEARQLYEFFEQFHGSPQEYGYAASHGYAKSRVADIQKLIHTMIQKESEYMTTSGFLNGDEFFYAKQSAELVKSAESYYRNLYEMDENTWNIRDRFFFETVCSIMEHCKQHQNIQNPKCVVWAHNSHCGDARATDSSQRGQWNIGQLFRQEFNKQCFNIGCLTYRGSVTAASDWDQPEHFMKLRNGTKGSVEHLLHEGIDNSPNFFINLRELNQNRGMVTGKTKGLFTKNIERYVGVIYRPKTEGPSHYSRSILVNEFDAIVFIDKTNALVPIRPSVDWVRERVEFDVEDPDLYPEVTLPENSTWVAEKLNGCGTQFLQSMKFAMAELKFTKALLYTNDNRIKAEILCNRAIAFLKRRMWKEAMTDCSRSLELESNQRKAHEILKAAGEVRAQVEVSRKH